MGADPLKTELRQETPRDYASIAEVNRLAFGGEVEVEIVERVRAAGLVIASLVAEREGTVAGHALFSRIWIDTAGGPLESVALGPVAVRPEHQGKGIGSQLIRRGLDLCGERGERTVLVLGEPAYYGRFGFSAASAERISSPFPPEYFMALELVDGALAGVQGTVRYPPAWGLETPA